MALGRSTPFVVITTLVCIPVLTTFVAHGAMPGPGGGSPTATDKPAVHATKASEAKPGASGQTTLAGNVVPFLKIHCYRCHADGKNRGDVALDGIKDDENALKDDRALWDTVIRAVQNGEMPPKRSPRPTDVEADMFVKSLNTILARVDCGGTKNPGRVTARRLNRVEYQNTIRDLLYIPEFTIGDDFPPDDLSLIHI